MTALPLEICITGGIACGKSTVGEYLRQHQFEVVEADEICRRLMQPQRPVYMEIIKTFGKEILSAGGEIDRTQLGQIVFNDPVQLKRLNDITHPPARAEINRLRRRQRRAPLVVIVPLVYEVGWEEDWPVIVCVAAPQAMQLARMAARGLDEKAARARLAAQWPLEQKMQRAHYVIYNAGSRQMLARQIELILQHLEYAAPAAQIRAASA